MVLICYLSNKFRDLSFGEIIGLLKQIINVYYNIKSSLSNKNPLSDFKSIQALREICDIKNMVMYS